MAPRASASRLAEIHEEHEALRRALEALDLQLVDAAVDGCDPAASAAVSEATAGLAARVEDHFAREEKGKYLPDVYEGAPRYAGRADGLLAEHALLRVSVRELVALVATAAAGDAAWAVALNAFRRFAERLREHERAESVLVQRALSEDVGSRG